jgi:hypothetical protein
MDSWFEKKKLMDKWKEYLQGKLNDKGHLNIEFSMGEVDFSVTN